MTSSATATVQPAGLAPADMAPLPAATANCAPTELHEPASLLGQPPADLVARAGEIAQTLNQVIRRRGLFSTIGGKDYVHCEGWTTLGAMLGILPQETRVEELPDGAVAATVELIRVGDGQVVGRASGFVGQDEPRWRAAPMYARRSMAVTRATSKAYRLGFSWIMVLAGFAPTPAEEMVGREPPRPAPAPSPNAEPRRFGPRRPNPAYGEFRQFIARMVAPEQHGAVWRGGAREVVRHLEESGALASVGVADWDQLSGVVDDRVYLRLRDALRLTSERRSAERRQAAAAC